VNHVLTSNIVFTVGMTDMVWSEIVILSAYFVRGLCACVSACLSDSFFVSYSGCVAYCDGIIYE